MNMVNYNSGIDIYNESISIINSLLAEDDIFNNKYSEFEKIVIKRVIHASSDMSYSKTMFFTENSIINSINFIKQKSKLNKPIKIVCDSRMTEAGISSTVNEKVIVDVRCHIGLSSEELSEKFYGLISNYNLKSEFNNTNNKIGTDGITRSAYSIRIAVFENLPDFIIIGNAPTALIETMNTCKILFKSLNYKPNLIIGMPVGFVGADDSKRNLMKDVFFSSIGNTGNLGGSAVAAAAMNAILKESI
ncbi:MAG: precorrin-8X methylmutase [Deltaproteobacteria bacterium]|nr:precorrin-8X methylmutase [Deltaproteobacteria bacterium]